MAKVLLVCAGGMSSSVVAKKVTQYLQDKGHDISLDFGGAFKGEKEIEARNYDYYLVGPHLKTHYAKFESLAKEAVSVGLVYFHQMPMPQFLGL